MANWLFAILVGCGLALALLSLGYLAACAGGQRWLTFREWWGMKHVTRPVPRLRPGDLAARYCADCDDTNTEGVCEKHASPATEVKESDHG